MMDMTYQKAIEAGVDIIDCALSPLSNGTSQPATEAFQYVLAGTQYDPKLNLDMLKKAADKLTVVKDKYLANGLLNPKALSPNPEVLKFQVPGGMLSNLMSQLKEQKAMNRYEEVLKEVPRVRKDMGYPPLVTPLSQMVGTQAVFNVMTGERYKMVPNEIKEYLHGLYGKSPAPVDEEIRRKIIGDDPVITHRPADDLAPEFEALKAKYKDLAQCDEDVLSIAIFEAVAVKFLQNKYHPQPIPETKPVETDEFNLFIGGVSK
jgi:oxaloacetate decarboxylase alpha subunit